MLCRVTHSADRAFEFAMPYAEDDLIGTWSTGTKAINAIPFVCAAKPGLVSPLGRMLRLNH